MKIIGEGIRFMPGIFWVCMADAGPVISRRLALSVRTPDEAARKAILHAACLGQVGGVPPKNK